MKIAVLLKILGPLLALLLKGLSNVDLSDLSDPEKGQLAGVIKQTDAIANHPAVAAAGLSPDSPAVAGSALPHHDV